jgi:DNA phosphorothioation-dependent restriction protein DptG
MRIAELLRENTDLLFQILKTVEGSANQKDMPVALHFDGITKPVQGAVNLDINRIMTNAGSPQFSFDTFNNAYEQDDRIKDLVKEFDKDKIILKTEEQLADPADQSKPGDAEKTVKDMAKKGLNTFLKDR